MSKLTPIQVEIQVKRFVESYGHLPDAESVRKHCKVSREMARKAIATVWDEHPEYEPHPQNKRTPRPRRYRVDSATCSTGPVWEVRDYWEGWARVQATFYERRDAPVSAREEAERYAAYLEGQHQWQVSAKKARERINAHLNGLSKYEVIRLGEALKDKRHVLTWERV